jgi:hypothetical protein
MNKADFFTVEEINTLVNDSHIQALKTFADKLGTQAGNDMRNKIDTMERVHEVIINPIDINGLEDFGKEIHYDPDKLHHAKPSEFLGEKWFSTFTDYPDTTQPVRVVHFQKSDFNKAARPLYEGIKKELLSGVSQEGANECEGALLGICKGGTDPHLVMEAAKYVIWFGKDKEQASDTLKDIVNNNWQEHPAIAFKASSYLIDLGENPQETLDEQAKILTAIAEKNWQRRPGFAMHVVIKAVKDSEENDTVQAGVRILKQIAAANPTLAEEANAYINAYSTPETWVQRVSKGNVPDCEDRQRP